MTEEIKTKLKGYLGLCKRGNFLFHSSMLVDKVYKHKIKLIIVNRKIDEYLEKALNYVNKEGSNYHIDIFYEDIEDIALNLFDLHQINSIGITNTSLSKQIKMLLLTSSSTNTESVK